MYRLIALILLISACSTLEKGGQDRYIYDSDSVYTPESLKDLAPKVVATLSRDPRVGKNEKLFSKEMPDIKRVGIVVFEGMIQNKFTGLSDEDRLFLSDSGKQLMTEKLLSIWEQTLPILDPDLDYISTAKIKKTSHFTEYGSDVTDDIQTKRDALMPDDLFYLPKGKKISMSMFKNPRAMRDVSFLLVPGSELMGGPKSQEQNKHFVNDIAKELHLDAVIIVQNTLSWTAARKDKNSGDMIPEEGKIEIKASILVPMTKYHERLKATGDTTTPNITAVYRAYEGLLKFPLLVSVPITDVSFDTAMKEVITPMLKSYTDLTSMVIYQMKNDLEKTY
jgi:hypothetical protein